MNLLTNVKVFSAFGSVIKSLAFLMTAIKVIGWLFLVAQVIVLFTQIKNQPLDQVISLD